MITAAARPQEKLRPARRARQEWVADGFGSLSTRYIRAERFGDPGVSGVVDSSLITDINATGRVQLESLDFLGRLAADHRHDLRDSLDVENGLRISSLFVEASHRPRRISGALGRQSANSGGVLGRFDGGRLLYGFESGWELGVVGGFPTDLARTYRVETQRRFAGVHLDTPRFFDAFQGQLYLVGQMVEDLVDCAAVGGELRYFRDGRFAVAFVDFDVYYRALNTAFLLGSWSLGLETDLNFNVDYRNAPPLTTTNALQGQPVDSIGELRALFTASEIRELARDRTSRSTMATLGLTHRLSGSLQVSGDVTLSEISATSASGGVEAVEGTGLEFAYGAQLIANGMVKEGDVGIVGLRFFDGTLSDIWTLNLNGRFPLRARTRINPRLRVDYRDVRVGDDSVSVRPTLRLDWRVWKLFVDAETGFEWLKRTGDAQVGDELGYVTQLGIRFDFQ